MASKEPIVRPCEPTARDQFGRNEIWLSDSLRLAERGAVDDVPVALDVTPAVPHVFQAFASVLEESDAALNSAPAYLNGQLPSV